MFVGIILDTYAPYVYSTNLLPIFSRACSFIDGDDLGRSSGAMLTLAFRAGARGRALHSN